MHAGRVVSFSHRPGTMAAEKRAYCVVDDSCIFARFSQMLIQEDDLATLGGSLSGLQSKYWSTATLFVAKINMASQANKWRSKQKYIERKSILLRSRYVDSLQDVIQIFAIRVHVHTWNMLVQHGIHMGSTIYKLEYACAAWDSHHKKDIMML